MMKNLSLIFLHLKASGLDFFVKFSYLFFANDRFGVFLTTVRSYRPVPMVVKPTGNLPVFFLIRFFLVRPGGMVIFYHIDGRKTYSKFLMFLRFYFMFVRLGGTSAYARTNGR
jgi:hypothetical protein